MTDFTFLWKCNSSCLIFAQKTEIPLAALRLAGGGGAPCQSQQWKRHEQWWDFFFYGHKPLTPLFVFSMAECDWTLARFFSACGGGSVSTQLHWSVFMFCLNKKKQILQAGCFLSTSDYYFMSWLLCSCQKWQNCLNTTLNPRLGLVHTCAGGFLHPPWRVLTGTDQRYHNISSLN